MLFWLTAALLTFGACLAILVPMTRGGGPQAAAREHDLEVYRDQMAEVDRDARRGLIGPAEAEQARAEIGRRILRLAPRDGGTPASGGSGAARWAGLAAVLAVPLVSWSLYAALGSPDLPPQPLGERLARDPAQNTLSELVARAEAHLAANPTDGRGWEVLAPIYLRLGRYEDAVRAQRTAIELLGANAAREADLGEILRQAEAGGPTQQQVEAATAMTAEERGAMVEGMVASLDERLRQNPRDAEGWKRLIRSYIVLGRAGEARDALDRSVAVFGAGAPEAEELQAFAAALGMEADTQ